MKNMKELQNEKNQTKYKWKKKAKVLRQLGST